METDKAALRRQAFAARKAAHAGAAAATPRATATLLAALGTAAGRVVAGYLPIRTEIDPRPAMTALHEAGALLAVPVIRGPGQPLDFRAWAPGCALEPGPFGAMVPVAGAPRVPEVLIVPLVAFDAALNRLGYGGGYYDRTLAALRAGGGAARAVGLAYAAQELPALPAAATDIPLDAVATETGLRRR